MAIKKFNHLVDSYRNTISEWAVGFRYGNFTLKLARGLIFGGEEISIPESRPMQKSYISRPNFKNEIFSKYNLPKNVFNKRWWTNSPKKKFNIFFKAIFAISFFIAF
jgi:hypothetical protein